MPLHTTLGTSHYSVYNPRSESSGERSPHRALKSSSRAVPWYAGCEAPHCESEDEGCVMEPQATTLSHSIHPLPISVCRFSPSTVGHCLP